MEFAEILKKYGAVCEIRAKDKPSILRELSQTLAHRAKSLEEKDVEMILRERERVESTALGFGVALPHGKSTRIEEPICLFARSRQGVDFGALDGEPTHLFFAVLTPTRDTGSHLSLLAEVAKVSRLLTNRDLRESLLTGPLKDLSSEIDEARGRSTKNALKTPYGEGGGGGGGGERP